MPIRFLHLTQEKNKSNDTLFTGFSLHLVECAKARSVLLPLPPNNNILLLYLTPHTHTYIKKYCKSPRIILKKIWACTKQTIRKIAPQQAGPSLQSLAARESNAPSNQHLASNVEAQPHRFAFAPGCETVDVRMLSPEELGQAEHDTSRSNDLAQTRHTIPQEDVSAELTMTSNAVMSRDEHASNEHVTTCSTPHGHSPIESRALSGDSSSTPTFLRPLPEEAFPAEPPSQSRSHSQTIDSQGTSSTPTPDQTFEDSAISLRYETRPTMLSTLPKTPLD
ncbi:hypothetical protein K470DRAFT_267033 [Piedraia hortae CBS 480.64]|uniref:Uncharacterized protein n=1 Tax=Piedraia hortae CBS 480.64 TaxID=1314780 RepID=A0A6A7BQJ2_9PEZI|nr:hypothetical protein K470DRAFT_267033 [Piedraia hortae CBS 480.64]